MTAAAQALRAAADAGIVVLLVAGRPKAFGRPGPELLALLRAHKDEIVELLGGAICRGCGKPLPPAPAPPGSLVTFGDGTAECGACADREVGRLLAAGRRAVESPDALADPAEVGLRGEIE